MKKLSLLLITLFALPLIASQPGRGKKGGPTTPTEASSASAGLKIVSVHPAASCCAGLRDGRTPSESSEEVDPHRTFLSNVFHGSFKDTTSGNHYRKRFTTEAYSHETDPSLAERNFLTWRKEHETKFPPYLLAKLIQEGTLTVENGFRNAKEFSKGLCDLALVQQRDEPLAAAHELARAFGKRPHTAATDENDEFRKNFSQTVDSLSHYYNKLFPLVLKMTQESKTVGDALLFLLANKTIESPVLTKLAQLTGPVEAANAAEAAALTTVHSLGLGNKAFVQEILQGSRIRTLLEAGGVPRKKIASVEELLSEKVKIQGGNERANTISVSQRAQLEEAVTGWVTTIATQHVAQSSLDFHRHRAVSILGHLLNQVDPNAVTTESARNTPHIGYCCLQGQHGSRVEFAPAAELDAERIADITRFLPILEGNAQPRIAEDEAQKEVTALQDAANRERTIADDISLKLPEQLDARARLQRIQRPLGGSMGRKQGASSERNIKHNLIEMLRRESGSLAAAATYYTGQGYTSHKPGTATLEELYAVALPAEQMRQRRSYAQKFLAVLEGLKVQSPAPLQRKVRCTGTLGNSTCFTYIEADGGRDRKILTSEDDRPYMLPPHIKNAPTLLGLYKQRAGIGVKPQPLLISAKEHRAIPTLAQLKERSAKKTWQYKAKQALADAAKPGAVETGTAEAATGKKK